MSLRTMTRMACTLLLAGCARGEGGGAGVGGAAVIPDAGQVGADTGVGVFGGSDAAACGVHCSSDLHQVVDCNGTPVQTCASDQGCGAGTCVAACDAAAANPS